MDPFVPAYCAGLFDAKGTVHIASRGNNVRVQVMIVSSDRPVLEWFQRQWGGKLYPQAKPVRANWTQVWALVWTSMPTQRTFLTALKPYLLIKRQAAELALTLLEQPTVIGHKLPAEWLARRREIAAQFVALREAHSGA